jgi:hypothetical protein
MLAEAVAESILAVDLWTFQRNAGARRFYERNGFVAMEFTTARATRSASRTCVCWTVPIRAGDVAAAQTTGSETYGEH